MAEPSERDRQRLANIREAWAHEDEHYHALPFMLRLYDAARAEGRREAIEECAKMADEYEKEVLPVDPGGIARLIAFRCRALAKPAEKDSP